MRIALLSTEDLSGYVTDDDLLVGPLRDLRHAAEFVPWKQTAFEWREFDAAVIRTTWDYQNNLPAFLGALGRIESQTRLANPLEVVRWNADKIYLRDLAGRGARTVKTIWNDGGIEGRRVEEWFRRLRSDELVIKPRVGANAQDTLRLKRGEVDAAALRGLFGYRSCMVQPFMRGIVEEGEFSLFYFGGEYSHAVLKTPKASDFRVQEEHGGLIQAVEPAAALSSAGERIMSYLSPMPLYARADFVRDAGDKFALMELELIEPSMYLRKAEHAPRLFAEAIDRWLL